MGEQELDDPERLIAGSSHQFRLLADRASLTAWQTYRDAAAVDPDIAADWQQLQEVATRQPDHDDHRQDSRRRGCGPA